MCGGKVGCVVRFGMSGTGLVDTGGSTADEGRIETGGSGGAAFPDKEVNSVGAICCLRMLRYLEELEICCEIL